MKTRSLGLCAVALMVTSCAYFEHRGDVISGYMAKGQCAKADDYARNMPGSDDERFLALGAIQGQCYKNRAKAIEYLRYSAQLGNKRAADALISLGEKPPAPPQVIVQERVVRQPVAPQQVIIQQRQQPVWNDNLNKCIKDGGSLYCR